MDTGKPCELYLYKGLFVNIPQQWCFHGGTPVSDDVIGSPGRSWISAGPHQDDQQELWRSCRQPVAGPGAISFLERFDSSWRGRSLTFTCLFLVDQKGAGLPDHMISVVFNQNKQDLREETPAKSS